MIIYLDALFFLNFFFDFLLLMTVSITLKRNAQIKRLFLGSVLGSLSTFFLFFSFNQFSLFLFKLFLAIGMNLIAFGLKDKKYFFQNLSYFYMTSTVLGGFLYFLNLTFSEEVQGMIFIKKDFSINYAFLILVSPLILFLYLKQRKEINHYQQIIPVTIYFRNGKRLSITGFMDTGNKLMDPITKKHIILVNRQKLKGIVPIRSPMYVPYHSLNHHGILKCISIDFMEIDGKKFSNYLVGLSEKDLLKDGVECILNSFYLEEKQ